MSFYDSASLVFLPSGGAGKDGKAYSIKSVPEYGNELVTNGGFDTDSDWTLTNFTIANGKANVDSSVAAFLTQTNVATIGKVYRVEFTISDYVEGRIRLRYPFTNGDLESNPVQNQTYVYYGVATDTRFELQSRFTEDAEYKVDNISVKEVITASADFTFSRGSNLTATRVDSNGLIEKGRENLLENSVWDGVTTDTKPTGWTFQFVSGTGTFDVTATEGQIRFQTLDASSRAFIYSPTITTNGIVVASVYVDEVTTAMPLSDLLTRTANATALFAYEDGVQINYYSDNVQAGKRYSVVFNKTASTNFRFGVGVSSATLGDIVLSRPQIEVGLVATEWITSPVGSTGLAGILEDSPRFDYSGGASCPSLILEPSRTNEFSFSEYASGNTLTGSPIITENYAVSPDGMSNAFRIQDTTGGTFKRIAESFSVSANSTYTQSIFVKKATSAVSIYGGIGFDYSGGTREISYIIFDEYNGTMTAIQSQSTLTLHDAEDYGDYWRFSITATDTGSNNYLSLNIYACLSTNGTSPTAGVKDWIGYGLQLEEGSYPTSYIPNHSGGSVTRDADSCSGAGDASTFNDDEGVLYAEISALAEDSDSKRITISDGTLANRITIAISSNTISGFVNVNNVTEYTFFESGQDVISPIKIAVKYKTNDFALWINGTEYDVSTSGTTFPASTLSDLSFNNATGINNLFGNVKQVLYFPTALSTADLEILTGTSYESFAAMATALNYTTYE